MDRRGKATHKNWGIFLILGIFSLILGMVVVMPQVSVEDLGLKSGFQDSWDNHYRRGRSIVAEDFDGDGKTDILWRHDNGRNALWFMDGVARRPETGVLPTVSDTDWTVVGLRDFDGDGYVDILWRNLTDGSNGIWFMTGTSLVPDQQAVTSVGPEWSVVGTDEE